MRTRNAMMLIAAAAFPLNACSRASEAVVVGQPAPASVNGVIAGWPAKSQEVANAMIAKYGQPHEATATMLVWHVDLVEQVIDYRVPPELFDELAAYDGSVIVERTKGEMLARCDKEEMNFLALNLANDIVTGKRTVEEARRFYAETAMAFMNGERPPYTQGLQFAVPSGGTADPVRRTLSG